MVGKVSFSGDDIRIESIAEWKKDIDISIENYFSTFNQSLAARFRGSSHEELLEIKLKRLKEVEFSAELKLLAALEAAFRIDYLQRVYSRKKDSLSRAFRTLYKQRGSRARLEDDILTLWAQNTNGTIIFGELKAAFKYRHWLAHGRYWTPKLGQQYDFYNLYSLSQSIFSNINLYTR